MKFNRGAFALPLQLVLIIPFALQIFSTVSLVGYLSFTNGQKAVNDLASQLIDRTSNTVNQYLDSYLSIPQKVNQMNADAIEIGLLNTNDRESVGKYFWRQMQAYDLTSIGLQLPTGEGANATRYYGETVTIDDTETKSPSLPKNNKTYLTDNKGNRTKLIAYSKWDTLNQPAYTEPVKAGKPIWIDIYTYYDPSYPPYIVASAGRPVYDVNNQLLAVVNAEIHLLKLSEYLRKLNISNSGQVFIVERNGSLIANSVKDEVFSIHNHEIRRLTAKNSPNIFVKEIAKHIQNQFNNFESITQVQNLKFKLQKEDHYVQIRP